MQYIVKCSLFLFVLSLSLFVSFFSMNLYAFSSQVIVQLDTQKENLSNFKLNNSQYKIERPLIESLGIYLVTIPNTKTIFNAIKDLRQKKVVKFVQPNHELSLRALPKDPDFNKLWSLKKMYNNSDINAVKAWDLSTGGHDRFGNEIVVAIVDGGFDLNHKDLKQNFWHNRNEIPNNNIDDDKNGYIDDYLGWNSYLHNGEIPIESHGTHIAGIIGARGNNNQFIVGVNWNIKIIPVVASSRLTSVVLEGYGYLLKLKQLWINSKGQKGANIVVTNSSFGVDLADCKSPDFALWNKVYNAMGEVGILSVAATINEDVNVDQFGDVPTGCDSDYLITVTNTNSDNKKAIGAGFGVKSIDLGAPGTDIFSTVPGNNVELKSGTSMATPHVTGAVALLYSAASKKFDQLYFKEPSKAALILKNILLQTVNSLPDLKNTTVSGGKLNLYKAVKRIKNFK